MPTSAGGLRVTFGVSFMQHISMATENVANRDGMVNSFLTLCSRVRSTSKVFSLLHDDVKIKMRN